MNEFLDRMLRAAKLDSHLPPKETKKLSRTEILCYTL